MIGSGIPINQSKAPFPKDILASISIKSWRCNPRGFDWFPVSNDAAAPTSRCLFG
jgi:hypothetical protein